MASRYRPRDMYTCTREEMANYIREKRLKVIDFRNPAPGEYFISDYINQDGVVKCPLGYTWQGDDPRYIVKAPYGV